MPPSTRRPTVHDVARAAGVSSQSVSRVLNNQPGVSGDTRDHILKIMRDLGYRPNKAAQTLASQKSNVIEVITMDIDYSGPFKVVVGQAAWEKGYNVMFTLVSADNFKQALGNAVSRQVDGLVLIYSELVVNVPISELLTLTHGTPFLQVATRVGSKVPSVVIDQVHGARLATEHLIDLGHRHIAEIAGPLDAVDGLVRHQTWLATLKAHGLEPGPWTQGTFRADSGYLAMQRLLNSGQSFTAVFAGNDEMALGAMHALRESGQRVPEDMSIVGFDNIEHSAFFCPPLTTVDQDFHTLGRLVVEYLVSLIEDPTTAAYQRVLTPDLILRDSTAPPRTR